MKTRYARRERLSARARELTGNAMNEGLLAAGKEAWLFKMLGVGGERLTQIATKRGGRQERKKLQTEWWAPARLVRMNNALKNYGVSSKLRLRTVKALIEGRALPAAIDDALARYTEELLTRTQHEFSPEP